MWRDSRKAFYLHPITQTISQLSPAILSSCGNAMLFQSKNREDLDAMLTHMGRSAKGMHDLAYVHHLPRLEVGTCVVRFALDLSRENVQPVLMRPRMVSRRLPADAEIAAWYAQRDGLSGRLSGEGAA
jgi:hypothetical protein